MLSNTFCDKFGQIERNATMSEILKRKQVRVNLSSEAENHLAKLHDAIGALSETDIMTTILAPDKQAWTALAEIGRQLQILAQAQKGEFWKIVPRNSC